MHIPNVHDYSESDVDPKVAEGFLAENRKKQLADLVSEIVDDEFDRLENYANEYISQIAANRAECFLKKVLEGDEDAAMELLGDARGGQRRRDFGVDDAKPWAELIHGRLFETGEIELRRKIVEAHPDLLRNERIADLESVVEGLSDQVRKLEADLRRCHERVIAWRE